MSSNNDTNHYIMDGTNIDTSVFSYSDPKPHPSGGKVINLYNKNSRESLTISTPLMLTWGAQEGMDDKKQPNGKYTMALQFPTADYPNPEADAFLTSMRALVDKVKDDAIVNSLKWFGKEIKSKEVIDEKFNDMLKHPKKVKGGSEPDYNRPPTISIKIPQWSGVWKPEIYDEDREPLYINGKVNSHLSPLEYLKPKTHVICLMQCGGLWFINGKISITWNLKQAVVQKPKTTMEGTCFLKPKAGDREKMKSLPPPEDTDPDGVVGATMVEDTDDEDEEENNVATAIATATTNETTSVVETVVPAVAPAVAPVVEVVAEKKKIIRKKA